MIADRPDTPEMERICQHLLIARDLAAKLNLPLLAHIIDMAMLDIYGDGDESGEEEEGKSPISNKS